MVTRKMGEEALENRDKGDCFPIIEPNTIGNNQWKKKRKLKI